MARTRLCVHRSLMTWNEEYFGGSDCLLLDGVPSEWITNICVEFICNALKLEPGARVLDAGCGGGRIAVGLGKRGYRVTAIDVSRYQLERALNAAQGLGNVVVLEQDYHTMTFKQQFDAVIP